jgi:hypothetical protein
VQLVVPEAPAPGSYRAVVHIDDIPDATTTADFKWADETH